MRVTGILIVVLALTALVLCLIDPLMSDIPEGVKGFQRLTAGFGLGSAVNARWGYNYFDPRLERIEETNLFPIPGGYPYNPARGSSLSEFTEVY